MSFQRKYPIGAEIKEGKGVHFKVWAPNHSYLNLHYKQSDSDQEIKTAMDKEGDGYFSLLLPNASSGLLYYFKSAVSEKNLPDPASKYQPYGPGGPSCVVNSHFPWTDQNWMGQPFENQIIYEMHIGTFTPEGSFIAAMRYLEELKDLGITLIELMPINEFPGYFGWGYDGVNLFAPYHKYGNPQDVKAFVNKAHNLGIAVILDVVYNHFGPEDNYIDHFSEEYFSRDFTTDWGKAINFFSPPVREFFLTNVRYWMEEFHMDGLRLDDTTKIISAENPHMLAEIVQVARKAASPRNAIIIGENETQLPKLLHDPAQGGYGLDGLWNDDFHHAALVRLLGRKEAYYTDYTGSAQEFISLVKYGFLYQGQYYNWQKQNRGQPDLHLDKKSMIVFLENHDQIANTFDGKRIHQIADPGNFKALTCLLLLGPNTPMLFQGQEFGSLQPFLYFADHDEELNKQVDTGRRNFLCQFPSIASCLHELSNPSDKSVFEVCKLLHADKQTNPIYRLHKSLINLRRTDPVFQKSNSLKIDGAVLNPDAFLLRYFGEDLGDRLLVVNFGIDFCFTPAPEPLLVAGINKTWQLLWSSEATTFGGRGVSPFQDPNWKIMGHSAIVLGTTVKNKDGCNDRSKPAPKEN